MKEVRISTHEMMETESAELLESKIQQKLRENGFDLTRPIEGDIDYSTAEYIYRQED